MLSSRSVAVSYYNALSRNDAGAAALLMLPDAKVDVPGTATQLAQGVKAGAELPDGSRQATLNRTVAYRPPCPPPGTGPLHYVFSLYALDQMLTVPGGATRAEVTRAMDGHLLGSTILLGYFER